MTVIKYNDGLRARRRDVMLLLYTSTQVLVFAGKSIPGVAVVLAEKHESNGVWSNTSYEIQLADGWSASPISQGFESGWFIDRVDTLEAMAACLGLTTVALPVVEKFIQEVFPKAWGRFLATQEALDALEAVAPQGETREVFFTDWAKARGRDKAAGLTGSRQLLVNGQECRFVWDKDSQTYKPTLAGVVVLERVKGSFSTGYKLLVPAGASIEEVPVRAESEPVHEELKEVDPRWAVLRGLK